jgi:hypothetical protein
VVSKADRVNQGDTQHQIPRFEFVGIHAERVHLGFWKRAKPVSLNRGACFEARRGGVQVSSQVRQYGNVLWRTKALSYCKYLMLLIRVGGRELARLESQPLPAGTLRFHCFSGLGSFVDSHHQFDVAQAFFAGRERLFIFHGAL